jgi:RNA polymerase sigma-70 factor (ECF subfamily)
MIEMDVINLVQTLGPKLYRFFLATTTVAVAEELVQEVFTRLLTSNYTKDLGSMEAFAWGIAQNVRKEAGRKLRKDPVLLEELPEVPSPESANETELALKKAVSMLGEPQKTIFEMTLADLQINEIAKHLAIPEGTVKSHLHRGKVEIRSTFSKWGLL